jgi:Uma2 family endonuclease
MVQLSNVPAQQVDPLSPSSEALPTMYDLPSEDPEDPGLPDEFHDLQPQLLSRTLQLRDYHQDSYFTTSDLNLYYDGKHPRWYKRPDWFLVVDVPRLYEGRDLRRSYVVWQEGRSPDVVVEFLSPGTEPEDLGRFYDESAKIPDGSGSEETKIVEEPDSELKAKQSNRVRPPAKFELYEQRLRVPYYLVYSRYTQRLRYFKLEGIRYQEQSLNPENPLIWLDDLEIGLGIWQGEFEGVPSAWLRWCDAAGNWQLTDTEQERAAKEQERAAKEQFQAQLEQGVRNLLATGMPPAQVAEVLGLSLEQVQALQERG